MPVLGGAPDESGLCRQPGLVGARPLPAEELLVPALAAELLGGLGVAELGSVAGEVGGEDVVVERTVLVEGWRDVDRVAVAGARRLEVGVGVCALGAGADEDGLDGVV